MVLACHAALAAALLALYGGFGLVLALPLAAIAPGLWRGAPRVYAGASLLLVFYAGGGLMEAFAPAVRSWSALTLASIAALEFCGLILYVRLRAAELRRSEATAGRMPA